MQSLIAAIFSAEDQARYKEIGAKIIALSEEYGRIHATRESFPDEERRSTQEIDKELRVLQDHLVVLTMKKNAAEELANLAPLIEVADQTTPIVPEVISSLLGRFLNVFYPVIRNETGLLNRFTEVVAKMRWLQFYQHRRLGFSESDAMDILLAGIISDASKITWVVSQGIEKPKNR